MTNDMEVLVEEVSRAIQMQQYSDGGRYSVEGGVATVLDIMLAVPAFEDLSETEQFLYRRRAKAAIRATLEGVRASNQTMNVAVLKAMGNPTIETPGSASWDWLVAHQAAMDALLSQLKE